MKRRFLRFGGPTFPRIVAGVGRVSTWYHDLETQKETVKVYHGVDIPLENVHDWQTYVDRGMAEVVELDWEPPAGASGDA